MIVNKEGQDILNFKDLGFEIEETKDGSPTLRLINGTERGGESMHHSGGALAESCLIYGEAFAWGFSNNPNPQIVSLGLGLGYIEVLACVYSLLHNSSEFKIYSYESVDGLRQEFWDFYIKNKKFEIYEWILQKIAEKYELSAEVIRGQVKKALSDGHLILKGNFLEEFSELKTFDIFCYDAYSKKTSPELWDENQMRGIFSKGSPKSCVSSYASNGVLKRALTQAGYFIEKLDGFQGKRNRTWAYRQF